MNRGQCGPQGYSGHLRKKKNFLPLTGFRPDRSLFKGFLTTNSHFLDTLVPKILKIKLC